MAYDQMLCRSETAYLHVISHELKENYTHSLNVYAGIYFMGYCFTIGTILEPMLRCFTGYYSHSNVISSLSCIVICKVYAMPWQEHDLMVERT